MTTKEFKLPDIGEGIAEGEIVSWKVTEGQTVKEEDEFVEVMTDKATVMITAPYDGVVKELRAKEGDIVPVESVIAVFDLDGAGGGDSGSAPAKEESKGESEQDKQQSKQQDGGQEQKKSSGSDQEAAERAPQRDQAPADDQQFEQAEPGKVLAAPATRRRAREMGIDLSQVKGTGPSGRITNEDLERHAGGAAAPAAAGQQAPAAAPARPAAPPVSIPPASAGQLEERIPFRGLRRKIADAMSRSKNTAAHFTYVDDINVTELVKLRKEAKEMYADEGVNVTYLPFIMRAVVEAHRKFPMMNSALDETTNELVIKHYHNFGIATDTEQGLIVPVLKDVDKKSIAQLASELQELAKATREGKVGVDQLQGGSFTITNAGNIGGLFATPVINFPEVAILGVHAIKKTPVINDEGEVVPGSVMYLSVSIDHRIVDGATGARWMNVVKDLLENPRKLLLGAV